MAIRERRNTLPIYKVSPLYAATDLSYPYTLPAYLVSTLHHAPLLTSHAHRIQDLASSRILTAVYIRALPNPWQILLNAIEEQRYREAEEMAEVFERGANHWVYGRMPTRLRVGLEWFHLRRAQARKGV